MLSGFKAVHTKVDTRSNLKYKVRDLALPSSKYGKHHLILAMEEVGMGGATKLVHQTHLSLTFSAMKTESADDDPSKGADQTG